MKETVFLLVPLLLISCASSKPKNCTPLTGGFDLVSNYEGDCQRLTYHGQDLSAECSASLFVNEKKKLRQHSVVFQTKSPRGVVTFVGTPHRKTSKIYNVDVTSVLRSEHSDTKPGKPTIVENKDKGVCDIEILPGENIRVICSSQSADGKMNLGEFKTTKRKIITCMEQFPAH